MAVGGSLGGLVVAESSLGAAGDTVGFITPTDGCTDAAGISLGTTGVVDIVGCTRDEVWETVGLIGPCDGCKIAEGSTNRSTGALGAVEGTPCIVGGMVGIAGPADGFMAAGSSLRGLGVVEGLLGVAEEDTIGLITHADGCTNCSKGTLCSV